MINHGKSIFSQSNFLLEVRRIKPIHFSVFFVDGPSVVKLRLQGKTLSAGKSHQIKCEAIGAKPQATITWWVGGKQVRKMRALPFCNYYVMICILDVSNKYSFFHGVEGLEWSLYPIVTVSFHILKTPVF